MQLIDNIDIVEITVARRIPGTLFFRNLVERRSLLFQLVRRDFEQRFVGSAIGWVWGIINPLVQLVMFTFVFQGLMHATAPAGIPYPLFLFAGMLPWWLFSETVTRSAPSVLDQANLITKTVFPAEIVPVSIFLSTLISHFLALALMVAVTSIWMNQISIFLVVLPLYMLAVGLFAIGIGWIVSSLHVFLRDTAQVLGVVMMVWFWLTPLFIEESTFPKKIQFLLAANPMFYVVRAYREILLHSAMPNLKDLAIAVASGVVAFAVGGLFFRYMKRGFADVL